MVTLARFAYSPWGTFGVLRFDDFKCFTVERPNLGNQPNISCIPEGTYPLRPRYYNRGNYPAYEVCNVPGRSAILIHVANTMDEVQGCVAPGTNLGYIKGKWAVSASRSAFGAFMATMDGREDDIDIFFRSYA